MEETVDKEALAKHLREKNKHPREREFRVYIKNLLSTFMPQKYLDIYMSDEVLPLKVTKPELNVPPQASDLYGPFTIIRQAFTSEFVSTVNLTTLEFYGDGALKAGLQSFMMINFPNWRAAGTLNDVYSYYSDKYRLAAYSEQLDMPRWLIRDSVARVTFKEKSDIFESFIGALKMIGELYIGYMVGDAISRGFVEKFYATQEWFTDPREYDNTPKLLNDWFLAVPAKDRPTLKPGRDKRGQQLADGTHTYSMTMKGRIIRDLTNGRTDEVTGSGADTYKAIAERQAKEVLINELGITRETIEEIRAVKRDSPAWREQKERLESKFPKRKFHYPAAKARGGGRYIMIQELREPAIGTKRLPFYETVSSGFGFDEIEAFKEAVDNLIVGKVFTPVSGQNVFLEDPDVTPAFLRDTSTKKPTPTRGAPPRRGRGGFRRR